MQYRMGFFKLWGLPMRGSRPVMMIRIVFELKQEQPELPKYSATIVLKSMKATDRLSMENWFPKNTSKFDELIRKKRRKSTPSITLIKSFGERMLMAMNGKKSHMIIMLPKIF